MDRRTLTAAALSLLLTAVAAPFLRAPSPRPRGPEPIRMPKP